MVGAIEISRNRIFEQEVNAQADGNVVAVLEPVRMVHGNVDSVSGLEQERIGAVLELRLVHPRAVIARPQALQLGLGHHLAVVAVEYVNRLLAADLEQKIALAIDVVRRKEPWGGDKNGYLAAGDVAPQSGFGMLQQFPDALFQKLRVIRLAIEIGRASCRERV